MVGGHKCLCCCCCCPGQLAAHKGAYRQAPTDLEAAPLCRTTLCTKVVSLLLWCLLDCC
jgi:hypothetical protein